MVGVFPWFISEHARGIEVALVQDYMDAKKNTLYLVMVGAALSVIVLSLAGVATITGALPRHASLNNESAASAEQVCRRCGVIESVWNISEGRTTLDADASQVRYAVRVFMEDGTYRTLYYSDRPVFNAGERVKVSDGAIILSN